MSSSILDEESGTQSIDHKKFFSFLTLNIVVNIFTLMAGLISGAVCARILGPEKRGELAAIQTLPSWLGWLILGMPDTLSYYCARYPSKSRHWLITTIIIGGVYSIPLVILMYVTLPWILRAQSLEIVQAAKLYLVYIPICLLIYLPSWALNGLRDSFYFNLSRMLWPLAWLFAVLLINLYAIPTPSELAKLYLIILVLCMIPVFIMINRRMKGKVILKKKSIYLALAYGVPIGLGSVPSILNYKIDQVIMSGFLPPHDLGLYVIAVSWSLISAPLVIAFSNVLIPSIVSINNKQNKIRALEQTIRITIIAIILLILVHLTLTPLAIKLLFGNSYANATNVAVLLTVAALPAGINIILSACIKSISRPRIIFVAEIFGLCMTGLFLYLLLPRYHILGAAIASLISYTTVMVVYLIYIHRRTGICLKELLFIKKEDVVTFNTIFDSLIVRVRKLFTKRIYDFNNLSK